MIDIIFQIIFIAIMTIGILGLPVFYYLKSLRNNADDSEEENNE